MKFTSPRDAADRHGNAASRMPVQKVDDTQFIQEHSLHGFAGEKMDTVEHFTPYGFTAVVNPATGQGDKMQSAEGMGIFMGSNRTHGTILVTGDRRYRLYKLAEGEVALHDDQGHQVHIKRDGIYVSAPNSKKIVGQIMDDDTLPQDSTPDSNGTKNGQIKQAGRASANNFMLDKNGYTINHTGTVTINAPTIILNGNCHLGSAGGVPCAMQGSIDTDGDSEVANLAKKVFIT